MTGIQASGVGSGLDIATLISQLVAAERAPLDARISRRQSTVTTQISALGALKSSMSLFRDALAGLRTPGALALRSATSSSKDHFTAAAAATVPPGAYDVEVVRLASAQRLTSASFAGGRDAAVGTGTLTIASGTASFDVAFTDGPATLVEIRDAINTAQGNSSVTASLVNDDGGTRLVLSARATGVAAAVTVTQSGGDGGLAALVFDPANPAQSTMTEKAATDAFVRVNGYGHTSASNTVTDAVEGLTLHLVKAEEGTEHTVTVANDTAGALTRIRKFVTDYNNLSRTVGGLQAYDATTGKAGALIGDAYLRGVHTDLRRTIAEPVGTGLHPSLAAAGITTDATGQLVINETRLNAALSSDFDGVAALFAGPGGVAVRLHERMEAALKSDAQLAARTDSLNRQVRTLDKERAVVDSRMSAVEARYRKQFTALDTLLSQMQVTGNFLAQQLGALNKSSQ